MLNIPHGLFFKLISTFYWSTSPRVLLEEQVCFMGADVTHPGADQQNSGKPSIAAVVGSMDPRAFRFCSEIRAQASKQEYIENMEGMVCTTFF